MQFPTLKIIFQVRTKNLNKKKVLTKNDNWSANQVKKIYQYYLAISAFHFQ